MKPAYHSVWYESGQAWLISIAIIGGGIVVGCLVGSSIVTGFLAGGLIAAICSVIGGLVAI